MVDDAVGVTEAVIEIVGELEMAAVDVAVEVADAVDDAVLTADAVNVAGKLGRAEAIDEAVGVIGIVLVIEKGPLTCGVLVCWCVGTVGPEVGDFSAETDADSVTLTDIVCEESLEGNVVRLLVAASDALSPDDIVGASDFLGEIEENRDSVTAFELGDRVIVPPIVPQAVEDWVEMTLGV
jgi:hypothetical protein